MFTPAGEIDSVPEDDVKDPAAKALAKKGALLLARSNCEPAVQSYSELS
jgi:hypothetical protein